MYLHTFFFCSYNMDLSNKDYDIGIGEDLPVVP